MLLTNIIYFPYTCSSQCFYKHSLKKKKNAHTTLFFFFFFLKKRMKIIGRLISIQIYQLAEKVYLACEQLRHKCSSRACSRGGEVEIRDAALDPLWGLVPIHTSAARLNTNLPHWWVGLVLVDMTLTKLKKDYIKKKKEPGIRIPCMTELVLCCREYTCIWILPCHQHWQSAHCRGLQERQFMPSVFVLFLWRQQNVS